MSTLTILEGADATGKSSYGRWLAQKASSVLLHYGKPSGDWRDEYFGRLARNPAVHTILDRSFIGSRVWARLGYHPHILTENQWRVVCWSYAQHSTVVEATVFVRDPAEIVAEIRNRGESAQAAVDAQVGQLRFLQMLARNEVYYIPISAQTSNRLHHHKEGN